MLEAILDEFNKEVKKIVGELEEQLKKTFDFYEIEQEIAIIVDRFTGLVLQKLLNKLLTEGKFLEMLKKIGGKKGMKYKEHRIIKVRLYNGEKIEVKSPYFMKAEPKRRKRKKGRNKEAHLGLVLLGFIGRGSAWFVSEVVKLALLCPSFAVAKEVLAERRIEIDVKRVRRLCQELGIIGLENRGQISLSNLEKLRGHTLVIGIDGGRLRERVPKEVPKKEGQKRAGYDGAWREPKLFTIYLLDAQGKVVKEFSPLHDATMSAKEGLFALLEQYLLALDWSEIDRLVFCGDGAKWIWSGIETLIQKFAFDPNRIYQVVDYIHAKQNLRELVAFLSDDPLQQTLLFQQYKAFLWQGDMEALYQSICQTPTGPEQTQALVKYDNFFRSNQKRMQYQLFHANAIPCGSGCVESAIRRVINLRLKSPGTFWKRQMAEYFLFLRSQLISGRWSIFINNVSRRMVKLIPIIFSNDNLNFSGGFSIF